MPPSTTPESEIVNILVQFRSHPEMPANAFSFASIPSDESHRVLDISLKKLGIRLDESYSPTPIPVSRLESTGSPFAVTASRIVSKYTDYVVRASVERAQLDNLLDKAKDSPDIVGVFSDPRIEAIAPICPQGPIGSDKTVENLLNVSDLHDLGMDGTGVRVVIVDTGVNLDYLHSKGKRPDFDSQLSWAPEPNQPLGNMPVGHGVMCAYDVCIAAPRCTLVDHALLTSQTSGGSRMDGLLSDAVKSYSILLQAMSQDQSPFAGDVMPRSLVVNNSWGMFTPEWDFPVGTPQNYSDNPDHPFNLIVGSLEEAGADILFAAGNCGKECPDGRCGTYINAGIYGANSHSSVLSVAGVKTDNQRIGYSTEGPGRLENKKPDIASYTHFAGSGVYSADEGTSAATPVASGVVAAIRRLYPAHVVSPARLKEIIRQTATSHNGFDYGYGYGILNVKALIVALATEFPSI